MNRFSVFAVILVLGVVSTSTGKSTSTDSKSKRPEVLLLAGAKEIGRGSYVAGRIYLDTLINTYPDSPLKSQARTLVFFSYAREGGPSNAKAAIILQEIEAFLSSREPRPLVR
jgi:outer membrane protein assembly factor BamD (BamD/ComL family)